MQLSTMLPQLKNKKQTKKKTKTNKVWTLNFILKKNEKVNLILQHQWDGTVKIFCTHLAVTCYSCTHNLHMPTVSKLWSACGPKNGKLLITK